ncbi:MAG: hypothetical protein H6Q69_2556 [Firmicutes bacterium]|nr:hypothetical protein [Bacillota bacterium]
MQKLFKDKIKRLEGGAFQEFCDAYLSRKGYKEIFELGMQSGTMKTTTGNPDTYFKNKSGEYIFVAYTTQQSSINSKIEEDIFKCLDKSKTGVDITDIVEIICCHTSSTLDAGKDKDLHQVCENRMLLSLDNPNGHWFNKKDEALDYFLKILQYVGDELYTPHAKIKSFLMDLRFLPRAKEDYWPFKDIKRDIYDAFT